MKWIEGGGAPPQPDETYNEETFHYFLALERRRAERSGRPFLLLLVELKDEAGQSLSIEPMVASKLFAVLRLCLRETDFTGWYRQDLAAGAVLTELGDRPWTEGTGPVAPRVRAALCESLPPDITSFLQVPVYHFRPTLNN